MKRTLLILCALLAMAYSAGTQAQNVWDGTVATAFAGGSGTAEAPYLIANGAQLAKLAQDVKGGKNYAGTYFVLTADILLNDTTNWKNWETTAPTNTWTPIGSSSQPFAGTLDGAGHSVSGIYINSGADIQGLVGYLGSGGILQDLGVKASYIKGGGAVGGLCGFNEGTVTNCHNTGSVTSTSDNVGGVCGMNYNTVTNCYNTGSVTGSSRVGGLCGRNMWSSNVTNCYNTGNVTGTGDYTGGVCGQNYYGYMTNCYNTGSVEGNGYVGGVCGENWQGSMTNCYYLNTCGAAGEGTSKNADEFASGEVAWLLQNGQTEQVWGQTIGTDEYPVLGGEKVYQYSDGTYGNTPLQAGEDGFYLISNADELRLFASMVNSGQTSINGRLTADIVLNDTEGWENWGSTAPANTWTPIGTSSQPFTGTFDGQGHTVSGIYVNSDNTCQGFFGVINSATITNLHIAKGYIRGNGSVGGIVGNAEGGSIEDCTNGCTIASTGSSNGGIIGNGMGVQITGCTNNGPLVAGQYQNGGIAGTVENSTIDQCVNNADITVADHAGGIAGYNTNGTVSNCLNKGNVSTSNAFYTYTAGIVANNRGTGSVVKNCLNLGTISGQNGTGCRQNSIVCAIDSDGSTGNGTPADNCYSINTSGVSVGLADNSRDVTEEELESGIIANLLQGNQEELIWGQTIGADNSPVLGGPEVFIYGDGTCGNDQLQTGESGFYLISNADELRRFADMVNSGQTSIKGRLTADILLNDTTNWKNWNESTTGLNSWTPIGNYATPFTGTLDGDGHSVSGIYINSEADDQGLVGYLGSGGTLQNLGVKASYIKGGNKVGGLCGDNSGTVINCYNTGSVTGSNQVGGVCGYNTGTVTNCYNTGSVTGVGQVGGVCGYNWGTVTNCYNSGSVTGTGDYVGGLCGANTGTVTNCHNAGSVTGTDIVGGVCGYNTGNVTNSYNSGNVAGTGNYVGGVCGQNGGTVNNCYNIGSVTGSSQVGGVCGMNMMGTVTNCYNIGSVTGSSQVGGVCGMNMMGTVTNCYYLTGKAAGGIGEDYNSGEAIEKTDTEFKSGEVAWLLSTGENGGIWGQTIGTDESPVWQTEGNKVYKLTLQNGEEANALYANSGNFTLPAPAEREGYTFAGWFTTLTDDEQVQDNATLTADLTLYAQWTANSYTVTFEANGGEGSMNQQTFTYDVKQTLTPNAFTRTGYSFTGWNTQADGNGSTYGDKAEVQNLTAEAGANITLYAQWSINSYTIRFVNADGTVLQSSEVEYGQTPAYNGETPTKESTAEFDYAFAGWDPEIAIVTGDATYTATYTATKRSYTITFVDEDGATVLQSSEVEYGQTPKYNGNTPTKESTAEFDYAFAGWTPDIASVTGNATYTATYTETRRSYTITFVDEDGASVLQTSMVEYGETPAYNGETPTKASTAEFDYAFAGWTPDIAIVTGDATYTATYTATKRSYTITFVDEDGATVLQSSEVEYGQTPAYNGETPTKESTAEFDYAFAGWDPEIAIVTGDATYTATYTETRRSYTITFVDEDGASVLQTSMVEYGETPAYNGETPTKASTAEFDYAFAGWTPDIAIVTGDATYTATYTATKRSYTITFVDEDGATVLQSSEVEYGQTPAYNGETPTKESTAEFDYAFAGWDPEIAIVTGEATYTATYTETRRSYTITFVDEDGATVLQSSEVEYGQTPAYNGETPTKESTAEFDYAFAGWDPEIAIVTGNATYTATYTATRRSYTVTLALADGCEDMGEVAIAPAAEGNRYEYGTQVTITATANEGYTFVQWSDGDTNATRTITVTGDLTLTATFTATDPSALHSPEAGTWKAIGTDGMLRITGTEAEMTVYDMRGALVYRGTARTIHVTAGAYIVRIGNEVQKAIVK